MNKYRKIIIDSKILKKREEKKRKSPHNFKSST